MSSLSEIYFNYDRAIRQANDLEGVAKKLKSAANTDMDNILNDINRAWKSDSTPQYLKKGQKLESDMITSANNLLKIATAIRTIAKTVRDAELRAWRIANDRD